MLACGPHLCVLSFFSRALACCSLTMTALTWGGFMWTFSFPPTRRRTVAANLVWVFNTWGGCFSMMKVLKRREDNDWLVNIFSHERIRVIQRQWYWCLDISSEYGYSGLVAHLEQLFRNRECFPPKVGSVGHIWTKQSHVDAGQNKQAEIANKGGRWVPKVNFTFVIFD